MDLSFIRRGTSSTADLLVAGGDLYLGDDLYTSVGLSLFVNARDFNGGFDPRDITSRQGFWGDAFRISPLGSLLWKYRRSKSVPALLELVRSACQDALKWMVQDGVAGSVDVSTKWTSTLKDKMIIEVIIKKPSGESVSLAYSFAWNQL